MIIYQLHEHSGEYDYYCDRIIGSYLKKERAEEEKAKAEAKEKKTREDSKRCLNCPFLEENIVKLDNLLAKYPDYCTEVELKEDIFGDIDCENYYTTWDEATFSIEEVEVEE